MKRFTVWMLILSMALSLCACTAEELAEVTEAPATEAVEEPVELVTEDPEGQLAGDAEINYYVTVTDQSGMPVPGVAVHLGGGNGAACDTNELGVATFVVPVGQYTAYIEQLPFGYAFASDSREFPFALDATYLTVVVNSDDADTEQVDIGDDETPVDEFVDDMIPEG